MEVNKVVDQPQYDYFKVRKPPVVPDNFKAIVAIFFAGAAFNTGASSLTIGLALALLTIFSVRAGLETRLSSMKYRDYFTVLFFTFGHWQQLAEPEAVLVTRKPMRRWSFLGGMQFNVRTKDMNYHVDLITTGNRDVLLLNTTKREKAYELARELAMQLNLKLYEQAGRNVAEEIDIKIK